MTNLNGNTPIRVLLERETRSVVARSEGGHLYFQRDPASLWTQLGKEARINVVNRGGRWLLTLNGVSVESDECFLRGGLSPEDPFQLGGQSFHGALKVIRKGDVLVAVNVVSVEEYLMGTVASEMSPDWEIEALKAQVVASRSYARYMMSKPRSRYYDVEKTVRDQVYSGLVKPSPRVEEAVLSTKGEYLEAGGHPIKAFFHSRCGGTTETPRSVWNSREGSYQRGVPCPYCRNFPYTWSASFPTAQILRLFQFPPTFAEKLRIVASRRKGTSRVSRITVEAGNEQRSIDAEKFRSLAGYGTIKSTLFNLTVSNGEVHFAGVGAGHGVGMCQWGARYLARQGKSYREILAYYYPGVAMHVPEVRVASAKLR